MWQALIMVYMKETTDHSNSNKILFCINFVLANQGKNYNDKHL